MHGKLARTLLLLYVIHLAISKKGKKEDILHKLFRHEHRDHTLSDIESIRTIHMALNLTVDMETETIDGYVEQTFAKFVSDAWHRYLQREPELVLDMGESITVSRVVDAVTLESYHFERVCHADTSYSGVMRCALAIKNNFRVGEFKLRIYYRVTGESSALHFVPPNQTHGGKRPFLVSVTQPSNARGWIPCQDSAAVKFLFAAEIRVKSPYTALVSATPNSSRDIGEYRGEGGWRVYDFTPQEPVPPYLIAITVADIGSVEVPGSEVSITVWAEHAILQHLVDSGVLSVIPRMMDVVVDKIGDYPGSWYVVVITPPGYIFGGMEYPMMNYVSSTTLDLQRLTTRPNYAFGQMVAHELIHSWFGNHVTPKYVSHAWLAEGITVFLELSVMDEIYGEEVGMFIRRKKFTSLETAIVGFEQDRRILTPYLYSNHPFEGLNYVAYNKGALFLEYLASMLSRKEVEKILRQFLKEYKYQSVDTDDFVHILRQTSSLTEEQKISITQWLRFPDTDVPLELFPSDIYDFCAELYKVCLRRKVKEAEFNIQDIADVYNHGNGTLAHLATTIHSQMIVVLERLGKAASKVGMSKSRQRSWKMLANRLDSMFGFTKTYKTDPHTFAAWSDLALAVNHTATEEVVLDFLEHYGRIEMAYAVLGATEKMALRQEMAGVLATSYDLAVYPGYVEDLLVLYIEMFGDQ